MALVVQSTDTTTTVTTTAIDDLLVTRDTLVAVNSGDAIDASAADFSSTTILGTVAAKDTAVRLGDTASLTIGATGSVISGGASGVFVTDQNTQVRNAGLIDAGGFAAILVGTGGVDAEITNSGSMFSSFGILVAATNVRIFNSGEISTRLQSVGNTGSDATTGTHLDNSGSMVSGGDLFRADLGDHSIVNSGTMSAKQRVIEINQGGNAITNTGTMTSQTQAAIFIDDVGNDVGNLVLNSGAITSGAAGIDIDGTRTTLTNTATGSIIAAGIGIDITGSNAQIDNGGTLTATDDGIASGSADGARIVNTGSITSGADGIDLAGNGISVLNQGTINGENVGVIIFGDDAGVTNTGTLTSQTSITAFLSSDGGRIVNSGLIESLGNSAVEMSSDTNASAVTLLNSGTIKGDVTAGGFAVTGDFDFLDIIRNSGVIDGGVNQLGGNDLLVNSGSIFGDAVLGTGNDTYRAWDTGTVSGNVAGGTGKDVLKGAGADDRFLGGGGADTLRGRGGDDTLDGGGTQDKIHGGTGDDLIIGGAGKDTLFGNNGDDDLAGDAGADTLNGGRGADTLTGGANADVFVYRLGGSRDVITDFQNGTDKIDLSTLGLTNVADLKATYLVSDISGGVSIDFGDGDVLQIDGIVVANLNNADFFL